MVEAWKREREVGGGLIAGGVAFRIFLGLVPFGLVAAAVLSFWSVHDPDGIESAARNFGIGAAAAHAGAEALQVGDRSALLVLLFGLVLLAWFTIGAVRALVLAYAIAWELEPPRIRRPHRVIIVFNMLFLVGMLASVGEQWLEAEIDAWRSSARWCRSPLRRRSRSTRCGYYLTVPPTRVSSCPAHCSSRRATWSSRSS